MSLNALPGFRDFYPAEFAERAHILETWRRVVTRYGFVEYDGPPLEPLDLYTQKSGAEIVGQLYNFEDKGGRGVSLRPEMTPTFARMVAARAKSMPRPTRWFAVPQLFRYERQQKGRLREHFQLNVDIVGEHDVLADAELLSIAIETCRGFGLTREDFYARVSDRRLLNALMTHLHIGGDAWPAVYAVLDKLERQPREVSAEKLAAAGLAPGVVETVLGFGALRDVDALRAAFGHDPDVAVHLDRFAEFSHYLSALGVAEFLQLDLTIVRGLAYYTGIVFELFDAQGEFRAICGGGRYDSLLSALGGVDLPALGFGMGDVVLGELLRARGKMAVTTGAALRIEIVPAPGVAPGLVLEVATALRSAAADTSTAVSYDLSSERLGTRKLGKLLDDARRRDANVALTLSADGETPTYAVIPLAAKTATSAAAAHVTPATPQPIASLLHDTRAARALIHTLHETLRLALPTSQE